MEVKGHDFDVCSSAFPFLKNKNEKKENEKKKKLFFKIRFSFTEFERESTEWCSDFGVFLS